jgi:hypothetical protein
MVEKMGGTKENVGHKIAKGAASWLSSVFTHSLFAVFALQIG